MATKLHGDNIDILCPGLLLDCNCFLKSSKTRALDTWSPGVRDHQLCRCHQVTRAVGQLVVTKALCCTAPLPRESRAITCPPHLPHVSRYRSEKSSITCPQPSIPYKCVCLADNTRTRGNITRDTCSCDATGAVTRAVCCHSHGEDLRNTVITV